MPPISLKSNERVLLCGKTGSGKTYLARYITRPLKRLVVLDGKGTLGEWGLEAWNSKTMRDLRRGDNVRLRALPPIGTNFLEYWEEVISACFQAGNVTIYIDELYAVCPPNKNPSDALWSAYTRGRELGVGVWSATQRPVWIPLFALSEAEHFFVFRLQLMDDKSRLAAFMGNSVLQSIKDPHGFYYSRPDLEKPIYSERLEVNQENKGKLVTKNQSIKPPEKQPARRHSIALPIGGKL
jgi:energy-coupling factor transporter ATP-binding protein EcfA2